MISSINRSLFVFIRFKKFLLNVRLKTWSVGVTTTIMHNLEKPLKLHNNNYGKRISKRIFTFAAYANARAVFD